MFKQKISIFILIDALGWTYLKDAKFAPWLQNRRPLTTVLGYSSGAIPSILTGSTPSVHNQWNLLYLDRDKSPFRWIKPFLSLPDICLENRYSRKIINIITKRISHHEGYFSSYGLPSYLLPNFDLVEKKNIYLPNGVPGSETIFDFWVSHSIDYYSYSYHQYSDEEILDNLQKNIFSRKTSILFAYLAEVDAFLHNNCKSKELVNAELLKYSETLSTIYESAVENYDEVNFSIFSDHGMTPIYNTFNLRKIIESSPLQLGTDYLAVYDSTMARFWIMTTAAKKTLPELLNNCSSGRLLSQDEMKDLGLSFSHNKYGDLFFLLDPGTVIAPNFISSYIPEGMHGFHPEDHFSDGSFLSNRDDHKPESITDLMDIFKAETTQ